jgi:hypothetical protein
MTGNLNCCLAVAAESTRNIAVHVAPELPTGLLIGLLGAVAELLRTVAFVVCIT